MALQVCLTAAGVTDLEGSWNQWVRKHKSWLLGVVWRLLPGRAAPEGWKEKLPRAPRLVGGRAAETGVAVGMSNGDAGRSGFMPRIGCPFTAAAGAGSEYVFVAWGKTSTGDSMFSRGIEPELDLHSRFSRYWTRPSIYLSHAFRERKRI